MALIPLRTYWYTRRKARIEIVHGALILTLPSTSGHDPGASPCRRSPSARGRTDHLRNTMNR